MSHDRKDVDMLDKYGGEQLNYSCTQTDTSKMQTMTNGTSLTREGG